MKKNIEKVSHFLSLGYNKQKYTEAEILDGIKNDDNRVFQYIYKEYFPGIRSMVHSFNNNRVLDAEDIFQEGLIVATYSVKAGLFKEESTFKTYLFNICRNICLLKLHLAQRLPVENVELSLISKIDEIEIDFDKEELIQKMMTIIQKMDEDCRQIIDLRFGLGKDIDDTKGDAKPGSNMKFNEIATILNITPDDARQRFHRCREKLQIAFGAKIKQIRK